MITRSSGLIFIFSVIFYGESHLFKNNVESFSTIRNNSRITSGLTLQAMTTSTLAEHSPHHHHYHYQHHQEEEKQQQHLKNEDELITDEEEEVSSSENSISSFTEQRVKREGKNKVLRFAILAPGKSEYQYSIQKILPPVLMAVNSTRIKQLLPNWNFSVVYSDTECSSTVGPLRAFDFFTNKSAGERNIYIIGIFLMNISTSAAVS